MDQVQQIANETSRLVSGNDTYQTYKPQWRYLLESFIGGEEYRRAGHLHRYALESDDEYEKRLQTTPLQNHVSSVVSVYNSFLFRKSPERDLGSMSPSLEAADFMRDADFDGKSLNNLMKDVATWASVFGHCWIVLAKPQIEAATRRQELDEGVRPYAAILTPLTVLDWNYTRSRNGRYYLDYLRYLEEVNGDSSTVKEWYTDWVRTTTVNTKDDLIEREEWVENQLGEIPAVQAYNKKGVVRGVGISDVADIADAQKFIYNCQSEIDQSIRMDSHPSLVTTPDTQVGTGSGALIHVSENLDPGLKPYLLEYSGAGVDKILNTIDKTVASIDKMANIGAVRATESRTMSGVAMKTEFELLNARLAEKADNLELAEEQLWRLFAKYQGYEYNTSIDYPGSFNIRDTADEIEQLRKAAETQPEDAEVQARVKELVLDWLDPKTSTSTRTDV